MNKREMERGWVEIDLRALKGNVAHLRRIMQPGCKLMAVVKADAYGHGAVEVAKTLNLIGEDTFAVATIEEGITLRRHKIAGEILILGYTAPCRAADLQRFRLRQTVVDMAHAEALNAIGIPLEVEIKVDTGMHRLGIDVQNVHEIEKVYEMNCLKICGIYSHLCVSDGTTEEGNRLYEKTDFTFLSTDSKIGGEKNQDSVYASAKQLRTFELSTTAVRLCAGGNCIIWYIVSEGGPSPQGGFIVSCHGDKI